LRIASEEEYLARTFRAEYEQYHLRTRWRYLPGVRWLAPEYHDWGLFPRPCQPDKSLCAL